MLFAVDADTGWWVAGTGAFCTLLYSMAGWLKTKIDSNAHLMARVDELTRQVFALKDEHTALKNEHTNCQSENASLKLEIAQLRQHVSRLEAHTGIGPAAQSVPDARQN